MYLMALAVDYDGTIAHHGKVRESTVQALIKLKESGRKLILVTGRELDDLKHIFDRLDIFDRVVAENGALLYTPQIEAQRLLAEPPPEQFSEKLKEKGITPLSVGKVIVSTFEPHETAVLQTIRETGLGLEIIFNKGAVMVLPSGVNKVTGLTAALNELGLSMHNIVGVGDAENDHLFLRTVGLGVAVANAHNSVKESAGWVTKEACGQGVEELIAQLIENESPLIDKVRYKIEVGVDENGVPVEINPADRVLIAGNSGIGKSTLATALTEKMVDVGFQFCIFDPEGDYEKLENAINVGDTKTPPSEDQVIELLKDPTRNVVVNTLGVEINDRPGFFLGLAPKIISVKGNSGRPHWLIIDEAHHLMPASHSHVTFSLPKRGFILITVHPDELVVDALKNLNVMITLGPQARAILEKVSQVIGEPLPKSEATPSETEVMIWQRSPTSTVKIVKPHKPKQQHKRHTRKYALGKLDDEFCFYFRGPNNALRLKAHNLMFFLQIAEGIDDDTWMYHLKNKDYSDWFRVHIKDDGLADETAQIENDRSLSPAQSRHAIANLVKMRYTAPASENG